MLGVQLLGNEKLTVKEYPEPILTYKNDLLIQVKASGICGSEMHGYRGPTPHTSNGGHEVAGEVIDAGRSTKFKVGDRVGIHAVWGCGDCRWCGVGKYTYCNNRTGRDLGTHVERFAAPDHVCLKLPEDVPFDVGVLLTGDGCGGALSRQSTPQHQRWGFCLRLGSRARWARQYRRAIVLRCGSDSY